MNISRYNHFFTKKNDYFVYNSLTNSLAKLDSNIFYLLKDRTDLNQSDSTYGIIDPETLQLLKNMKVVDVDDDVEYNRIKFKVTAQRFNSKNLSLTINPTLSCNFRCSYCFEANHDSIFMDENVEDEIINYIKSKGDVRNLFVTWFGGEPLMAFNRIKTLTKKILNLELNYHAGMITNGYLLSEEVILELDKLHIESLQITLDGKAETHNKRRFLKGGHPTYSKIIDNIILSQKLSPQTGISVRVNIDKTNEGEFVELYNHFAKLNLPNLRVYPGFVTDISGKDCDSCLFSNQDMSSFINNLYNKYGIYIPMIYPDGNITSCSVRHFSSTVIGPEGELYKCWNDVGNKEKVYGFLSKGIENKEILLSYLMDADNLIDDQCKNCKFLPVCNGGCPYVRIQEMKKGNKCDKACMLFKDNTDDFLWNHYCYKNSINNNDDV